MKIEERKQFYEGLNFDDGENAISINQYRDAYNIKLFTKSSNNDTEVQSLPSTLDIFLAAGFSLPTGTNALNRCIGIFRDEVKGYLYFFNYHFNSVDSTNAEKSALYRYRFDEILGHTIQEMARNTTCIDNGNVNALGIYAVSAENISNIHSIDIVRVNADTDILVWTPTPSLTNGLEFDITSPRELDLSRCLGYNWSSPIVAYTSFIKQPHIRGLIPSKRDNFASGIYPNNNADIKRFMSMVNDGTDKPEIDMDGVQFICRYVYKTGATSVWSGVSPNFPIKLTQQFNRGGYTNYKVNAIFLELRSPIHYSSFILNNNITDDTYGTYLTQYEHLIDSLEIAFREDYQSNWKYITSIPYSTINGVPTYKFVGGGSYSEVANIETNQLFDSVPLQADTVKVVKGKVMFGNCKENYDYDSNVENGLILARQTFTSSNTGFSIYAPNSIYNFGIELMDMFGRTSSIYANKNLFLNTEKTYNGLTTIDTNGFNLTVNETLLPPYCVGYRVKRTKNTTSDFYLYGYANNVQYVKGYVNASFKKYQVNDVAGPPWTYIGLNYLYFVDNVVPKDILIGDVVKGEHVEDGTIVADILLDPTAPSDRWVVLLSKPLTTGLIPLSNTFIFQSQGINAATYVANQFNNTPLPNVSDGTSDAARVGLGIYTAGLSEVANGIASVFGNDLFGFDERAEEQRKQEQEKRRRENISLATEKVRNADFQIGNPIFLHKNFYPTGSQKTEPNDTTNLGWMDNTAFEAKELYFDISNFFTDESGSPYNLVAGDLLSVVHVSGYGVNLALSDDFKDMKIKEQRGNYLIVDCPVKYKPYGIGSSNGNFITGGTHAGLFFNQGTFIQIRRPFLINNQLPYYDIGQFFMNTGNASRLIRIGQLTSDTLFALGNGDSYLYTQTIKLNTDNVSYSKDEESVFNSNVIAINPNTKKQSLFWQKDWGLPNLILQNKEFNIDRTQLIRFGLPLIQNTNINNINRFLFQNQIEVPNDYGEIIKLEFSDNLLVIICKNEVATAYVDERVEQSVEGQITRISNSVINNIRKLKGSYGTSLVNTITNYKNVIYWLSDKQQCAVKYAEYVGVEEISKFKADSFFFNYLKNINIRTRKFVGGFDSQNNCVVFNSYSKTATSTLSGNPIVFSDQFNVWISQYSFGAEMYTNLFLNSFSFVNGKMWLHQDDTAGTYNNMYGQNAYPQITVVFNLQPDLVKRFNVIVEESLLNWEVVSATCENIDGTGQSTFMQPQHFEKINQNWWADVLSDVNTPFRISPADALLNGDAMTGKVLTVTFRYVGTGRANLKAVRLISDIQTKIK